MVHLVLIHELDERLEEEDEKMKRKETRSKFQIQGWWWKELVKRLLLVR